MSPQGAPGQPKSKEHKAAISSTMQAKAEIRRVARSKASDQLFNVANLLSGEVTGDGLASAVVRLKGVIADLVEADAAVVSMSEARTEELKSALELAEADSQSFREALRSVSDYDIIRAKSIGLLPAAEADVVIRRRQVSRATGIYDSTSGGLTWGTASVSGYLPCAESGCQTKVDLKTGTSRCPDHKRSAPRTVVQRSHAGGMTFISLDQQLEDAEDEHAKAEKTLAKATEALDQIKVKVAEYDGSAADE